MFIDALEIFCNRHFRCGGVIYYEAFDSLSYPFEHRPPVSQGALANALNLAPSIMAEARRMRSCARCEGLSVRVFRVGDDHKHSSQPALLEPLLRVWIVLSSGQGPQSEQDRHRAAARRSAGWLAACVPVGALLHILRRVYLQLLSGKARSV